MNDLTNVNDSEIRASFIALKDMAKFIKIKSWKKYDYVTQAYAKLLEVNKDKSMSFKDMVRVARSEISRIYASDISMLKKYTELPDDEYCEEHPMRAMEDNNLKKRLDYETLKYCFVSFYKNYNLPKKEFIIDRLFKGVSPFEIKKKYQLSTTQQLDLLYEFRKSFLNYLVDVEYFESNNNFTIEERPKSSTINKINYRKKKQVKQGSFDYSTCLNDLKVYELIRQDGDLNKYSDYLKISYNKLIKILHHGLGGDKLFLYQINMLRKKYFNDYTLEELAS